MCSSHFEMMKYACLMCINHFYMYMCFSIFENNETVVGYKAGSSVVYRDSCFSEKMTK